MRRILMILCLLAVCVVVSIGSIRYVTAANDALAACVARSLAAIAEEDENALTRELDALAAYWDEKEGALVHFIRHSGVDDITKTVARLPALAAGKDYTELAAELESVRTQMEHLSQSESLTLENLF